MLAIANLFGGSNQEAGRALTLADERDSARALKRLLGDALTVRARLGINAPEALLLIRDAALAVSWQVAVVSGHHIVLFDGEFDGATDLTDMAVEVRFGKDEAGLSQVVFTGYTHRRSRIRVAELERYMTSFVERLKTSVSRECRHRQWCRNVA